MAQKEHGHGQAVVKLTDGHAMPVLGLGTYENTAAADIEVLKKLVAEKVYVHIDTASFYKNEAQIGAALKELFDAKKVKREDLYVTSKIFMHQMGDIEGTLRNTLKDLQFEYLDLYLIHWPIQTTAPFGTPGLQVKNTIPLFKIWAELEGLVAKGLVKSIGVSNFNFQLLADLLSYAKIKPVCNQIELQPYLSQEIFVDWMKENSIVPVAYSPLAKGVGDGHHVVPLTDPVITKIAAHHKKSPAQIILAWHLARGHVIIPKSAKYERAVENAHSVDVKLAHDEIAAISHLNKNHRTVDNKNWGAPFNKVPLWL